jgi:hypothetical protein
MDMLQPYILDDIILKHEILPLKDLSKPTYILLAKLMIYMCVW